MDSVTFGQILRDFGFPLAALVAALWSGARKLWVFGWSYQEAVARAERAERDAEKWRQVAFESVNANEQLVSAIRGSVEPQHSTGAQRS